MIYFKINGKSRPFFIAVLGEYEIDLRLEIGLKEMLIEWYIKEGLIDVKTE